MPWWPRHTPSTGHAAPAKARISALHDARRPRGGPGPGESSTASGSSASGLVEGERVVAVDDRARRRAHPGTARGCRRTSRSCRSPARGSPRRPACRGRPAPVERVRRLALTVDAARGTSEAQDGRAGDAQGHQARRVPDGRRRRRSTSTGSPTAASGAVVALHAADARARSRQSPLWVPVLMFAPARASGRADHRPQLPRAAARRDVATATCSSASALILGGIFVATQYR